MRTCAGCGRLVLTREEAAGRIRDLLSTFDEPGIGDDVSRTFVADALEELLQDLLCPLCGERTEEADGPKRPVVRADEL